MVVYYICLRGHGEILYRGNTQLYYLAPKQSRIRGYIFTSFIVTTNSLSINSCIDVTGCLCLCKDVPSWLPYVVLPEGGSSMATNKTLVRIDEVEEPFYSLTHKSMEYKPSCSHSLNAAGMSWKLSRGKLIILRGTWIMRTRELLVNLLIIYIILKFVIGKWVIRVILS